MKSLNEFGGGLDSEDDCDIIFQKMQAIQKMIVEVLEFECDSHTALALLHMGVDTSLMVGHTGKQIVRAAAQIAVDVKQQMEKEF